MFAHVLVGIDTTAESVIGAAQAKCLFRPVGELHAIGVAETHLAAHAGFSAPHAADELVASTREELECVRELVDPDAFRLVAGSVGEVPVAEAKLQSATLGALGAPRHRRVAARLFGGPDIPLLRDAPCSVLVGRAGWGTRKARRILVGLDGSPEADAAEPAARLLAGRLDCEPTPVIALGRKPIALLRAQRDDALLDPRPAVDALPTAPEDSLVVVGGRVGDGLGSVGAHVAHEASCSVLVVRDGKGAAA